MRITQRDQAVLLVAAVLAAGLSGWHWACLTGWGRTQLQVDRPVTAAPVAIHLNRADWIELSQLEGIGPTLARRIVSDRHQNGPFADVEQLQRVRGIGPATVARLRPFLTVEPLTLRVATRD